MSSALSRSAIFAAVLLAAALASGMADAARGGGGRGGSGARASSSHHHHHHHHHSGGSAFFFFGATAYPYPWPWPWPGYYPYPFMPYDTPPTVYVEQYPGRRRPTRRTGSTVRALGRPIRTYRSVPADGSGSFRIRSPRPPRTAERSASSLDAGARFLHQPAPALLLAGDQRGELRGAAAHGLHAASFSRRSRTSGSARARRNSAFRRSTIGAGAAAGAIMPNQASNA